LKQLLIRLVEVFVFPFVLPREIPALPHVGEAITPGSLLGTFLESVGAPVLISFRWGLLAKDFAKLIEMRLRDPSHDLLQVAEGFHGYPRGHNV
jgi:hypothetical protein